MTSDVRVSLRAALEQVPSPVPPPGDRLAAVLLPLIEGDEPSIVFTRRHDDLPRHPGEISFPGGLPDPGDPGLSDTALRETREELGIQPGDVDVLGALEPVHTTVSGILVVPFVGALAERPEIAPNEGEIAEVLEYPVRRLAGSETELEMERGGRRFRTYVFDMDGNAIWGATARILHGFLELARKEVPWLTGS